jgi:hypothetical protein
MVIAIRIASENLIQINPDPILIAESNPGSSGKIDPCPFPQSTKVKEILRNSVEKGF